MKKILIVSACLFLSLPFVLNAQSSTVDTPDSTGFAGDNFSLEGALSIFQEAKSMEEFEKQLNAESSYVNNLDLNEDGDIDYIQVVDNLDEDVHAIVLQTAINENETQDIAVILIEKTGKENAVLQIIGDEDVYGEEKIVEPYAESAEGGGKGNAMMEYGAVRIVVNVWAWPAVRFVYAPTYVVYRSPWRWHYYPPYWRTWHPRPWRWHYQKRARYHTHFRPYHKHRVVKARNFYKPRRKSSTTVRTKTVHTRTVVRGNGKKAGVKHTKTTTVSKKTKKNNKVTSKTTSTTTKVGVKKNNGKVTVGKSTTKTTTKTKKAKKGGKVKTTKTKTTTKTKKAKRGGKVKTTKTKTTKTKRKRR